MLTLRRIKNEHVAIKIIKNKEEFLCQAQVMGHALGCRALCVRENLHAAVAVAQQRHASTMALDLTARHSCTPCGFAILLVA